MNVRRAIESRPLRPLTAVGYDAVVGAELVFERVADAFARRAGDDPLIDELTLLVKTFERRQTLRRLVTSIRRFYPKLRIVVVDDSREPELLPGIATVTMPYDSGLGAGRNEGLRHATSRYVLVLDDDFVFYRHTRLAESLAAMERHPEIDIMGGQVVNLPFYRKLPVSLDGPLYPTDASPTAPIGSRIGDYEVAAKVPNFFVARRERLELVPWDPKATRSGHADFFTRALGVLITVYNPALRCLHVKTPFADEYMAMRLAVDAEADHLAAKYGAD